MSNNTKHQLIEAAGATFGRYGFKKTTMDDIALAAGKAKSSVYYYFKNKEEVFEAVTELEAERMKVTLVKEVEKQIKAKDKLRHYITVRMKRFAAKGNLYNALTDNFTATFSFIDQTRNNYRDWEIIAISGILEEGMRNKEFKVLDPKFTAEAILTCMIGFEIPLLTKDNTPQSSERKINSVVDMLFNGICM